MTKHIPSINQCLQFIDQFEMLDNIRAHSFKVARVAEALVDGLGRSTNGRGPIPHKEEVIAGALLHDIAKTLCLKTGCLHAEEGQRICVELGYPAIGEIVAEHVVLKNFAAESYAKGIFGPKEMVFYADKRVRHDQVVPLSSRLDYILERYGLGDPSREHRIRLNFNQSLDFENYLFNFLDFKPDEVENFISSEPFTPEY